MLRKLMLVLLSWSLWNPCRAATPDVVALGDRRELFIDRHVVERLEGCRLAMGNPRPAGTAVLFDRPWEGAFCGYATVLIAQGQYHLYYRGLPESGRDGSAAECTCYAQSSDGVVWNKPALRLFSVPGHPENNIVLADEAPFSHNFCPFFDEHPGVADGERFKALAGTSETGLWAFVSADGLRWRKLGEGPVFQDTGWVFDSQNVPCWSASDDCYVLYYRQSPAGIRSIARATSVDFLHWTTGTIQTFGDAPAEHLYTNQTLPYYRAPQVSVGIAARFMPGRRVLSAEQAAAIRVDPGYFGDCSDAVLLTTRGGNRFDRTFLEAFVRPGLGWENWVSRTNYPALGVVPTGEGEMSFYVQKNYGQPTARLERYALRTDGFASLHADRPRGECLTRALSFHLPVPAAGGNPRVALSLNFATSAAGSVQVEVQDASGQPLAGWALSDCQELIGDDLDRLVRWNDRADLGELDGQPLRLRLVLSDADVYSFRFQPLLP